MFLDFSKIRLRTDGTPEEPTLVLKSLDERTIGVVSNAYNVRFEINLSDLSTIEFAVPYMTDGVVNPLYKQIDGYKVIHTEAYGVYVLMRPQTTGDGIKEVKTVTGYSLEYLGEKKRMFLEEGTYNFWNPVLPDDTILGRVLEVYQGWSIGYVDPSLVGMYRTFDQYDADALKFCYSDAMDKFQCVIVFDVYEKTISAYNANESRGNLPIYLSYENLVKSVDVSELTDEIVTKLHVYGADDLSIAGVNPAGTDAIIDLSYFIGRGELNVKVGDSTQTLAEKYENWQDELLAHKEYYSGLISMRVSVMSKKLMLDVELAELNGELETIKIQQNITIQALAMETTDAGKKARGEELSMYKQQYDAKQAEINAKKLEVEEVDAQIAGYTADIVAVNNELGFDNYFTPDELLVLDKFLIESDFVEETFVASDVSAVSDGDTSVIEGDIVIEGAEITRINLGSPTTKSLYSFTGGNISMFDLDGMVVTTIPAGRLLGDLDGDGIVGAKDSRILQHHLDGTNVIADEELLAIADIMQDGVIDELDSSRITTMADWRMTAPSQYIENTYDTKGNWVLEKATDYIGVMFVTDIAVPDMTSAHSATVTVKTSAGSFVGECMNGALRVYSEQCPSSDIAIGIIMTDGDGSVEFIYDEGWELIPDVSASIIRGTAEITAGELMLTMYLGNAGIYSKKYQSGTLTLTGVVSDVESDIQTVTVNEVAEDKGTQMFFAISRSEEDAKSDKRNAFISMSTTDYQEYAVAKNLYDFGAEALADMSSPTYEFAIDSTNFLFMEEFIPFKNKLELGKGLYLNLASEGTITANAIGVVVDFGNRSSLSMTFSNRYKKKNGYKTLEDMIKGSYSSSRSFDASKYTYGKTVNQVSNVTNFMNSSLDASVNAIIGAANQSVVIDGAGVNIGGNSDYQLRIIDSMIAMTSNGWQSAELAIGRFATEEFGEYWGVNAQLIGGKLIVGNNLVIENVNSDDNITQFRVDASGAWMHNSTFVLQKDSGGKIIIDPAYGIVAGEGDLFTTNGTTVSPSFIDEDGNMVMDDDGFPENANFYLDIRDGTAYFRGTVQSGSGSIGGWTIAENQLYSGSGSTYVALNSSASEDSLYAMWAGSSDPASSSFYVKRDGTVFAKNGTFGGHIEATSGNFSGTLNAVSVGGNIASKSDVMDATHYSQYDNQSGWLLGCGIDIGNGKFKVDQQGNVQMTGTISWGASATPSKVLYARAQYSTPAGVYDSYPTSSTTTWHKTFNSAYDIYASYSNDGGFTWGPATLIRGATEDDLDGLVPDYILPTYINEAMIYGPHIYGGRFYATGEGRNMGAAFYIAEIDRFDSDSGEVSLADPLGWLSYDTSGAGDDTGAKERVILKATMTPLKLECAGNMSLRAGVNWGTGITNNYAKIYIQNPISMTHGTMWGTTAQMNAIPSPESGQLFFVTG